MDNNILELDDKMLFIKFAYFSFTKVEVFFRVWLYGTSDLKRKRFRVFSRFLNFFSTFCGPKGGRMEDYLQRASRIRVFPRNATNDRIMSKAAKNIGNCFTSSTRAPSREQYKLPEVFCISSTVSFSILIFL